MRSFTDGALLVSIRALATAIIIGDDIGIMRPSIYHRGLMVRETPDIDRAGNDEVVVAQMQVRLDSI
jgi:hypothetical protein